MALANHPPAALPFEPKALPPVNDLFVMIGIESWKPALEALLLPPVPFVLMVLVGARVMYRRRLAAWTLVLFGALGCWFMCTSVLSHALTQVLLMPPRALSMNEVGDLKKAQKTAIVVLGGGRRLLSPEYGLSNLNEISLERLRYGIWLSRETGLPLAFSGGVGWGGDEGPPEADIAARIADKEFGRPLRWTESQSRDTNENAMRTVQLMKEQNIERLIIVTHDYHMRRAMAAFARAVQRNGSQLELQAAPMGLPAAFRMHVADWFPSPGGFRGVRFALHEWIGRLAGA